MKTPFGTSVAAIKLAEMVKDNKKVQRAVGTYFTDYMRMLVATIGGIKDLQCKRKALLILRKHYFETVNSDVSLPSDVKGYLLNAMAAQHKNVQKALLLLYGNIEVRSR